MKTGIDVSAWQGAVDWQKARDNGAAFAFIKASQQLFSDRRFINNWQGARLAGLPRGAYHYLTWDTPAARQANFFSHLLKDDPGEISPVVDFEESSGCPTQAAAQLRIFIEAVEQNLGRACMVYTSPGFWQSHGSRDVFFGERPLWIAHWGAIQPSIPLPWSDFAFWQFTNKGDGAAYGVSSHAVDCSYVNDDHVLWDRSAPASIHTLQTGHPFTYADQLARLWAAHPELH